MKPPAAVENSFGSASEASGFLCAQLNLLERSKDSDENALVY